ncbi:hypothetical protein A7K91_15020 [Paenibacillus oryzae]|uniref:Amino acid transporter n=1 Tax=Paenibacillus oryzae TaxID=1844972 RepID=A0A1A5YTI4_9BACL|nr:hypothetical protein A7K91_15020 [Paenibacillus oryzae]
MYLNHFKITNCIASLMKDYNYPWAIAGGWAIDLYIGNITRDHEDIEIVIFRDDQKKLQDYLVGWNFKKVSYGEIEPWQLGERLELPIHETYAEESDNKLEVLLNESEGNDWVFRRDNRIRKPKSEIILQSLNGVRYLCPEIVLLYKSKNPRYKDQEDFKNINKLIETERKEWLINSLKTLYVEHPWIEARSR